MNAKTIAGILTIALTLAGCDRPQGNEKPKDASTSPTAAATQDAPATQSFLAIPTTQEAQTDATTAPAQAKLRIVDCDAKIQSRKRGVCANKLSEEDFRVIWPGVSWYYNWSFESKDVVPADAAVEFVPMAWTDKPECVDGLEKYLETHRPRAVLAINEPNLRGQAFISPEKTAKACNRIKAIAKKQGIAVVGPNMALGSAEKESIRAADPLEKKEVTYTFMMPFLKATFFYSDKSSIDATAFHGYGNLGELKWATELLHKEFEKPVWVTEFAQWQTSDEHAALVYLMQATDFLERTSYVDGYAWFKERVNDNPRISLFEKESGKLSSLGRAYVAMPVHDADLFYRIPGRLQTENYVAMKDMDIFPTDDADGFAQMTSTKANGWLEYSVQVPAAGKYGMNVRTNGVAGAITMLLDERPVATLDSKGSDWNTAKGEVDLPAGAITIRLKCSAKEQIMNWIEFKAR